jgi:hypothetical protein
VCLLSCVVVCACPHVCLRVCVCARARARGRVCKPAVIVLKLCL